jgi:poly(3-hydroxybutyrate) depolymerase
MDRVRPTKYILQKGEKTPAKTYNSGTNGILSNPDSYQDFISVANVRRNWATERDVLSSMAT